MGGSAFLMDSEQNYVQPQRQRQHYAEGDSLELEHDRTRVSKSRRMVLADYFSYPSCGLLDAPDLPKEEVRADGVERYVVKATPMDQLNKVAPDDGETEAVSKFDEDASQEGK